MSCVANVIALMPVSITAPRPDSTARLRQLCCLGGDAPRTGTESLERWLASARACPDDRDDRPSRDLLRTTPEPPGLAPPSALIAGPSSTSSHIDQEAVRHRRLYRVCDTVNEAPT